MGYSEFVKHLRYKSLYGENEVFWGLGIEEETYLQFTKPIYVAAPIIRSCHGSERYSVRYFKTYKPGYKAAFEELFTDASGFYPLPLFMNSHAFTKLDLSGNHATTYATIPKSNPQFNGKSFFDELSDFAPSFLCYRGDRFLDLFNRNFIFDGDSIEFMTQNFYKTTVSRVVQDMVTEKGKLLECINSFLIQQGIHREKGLLEYPKENPGFIVNYTNPGNISMFNNGTYHINITLPTALGMKDKNRLPSILDYRKFKEDHRKFIRFIQWLEPFIVGVFGTSDPLSKVSPLYSKGSQRCAVSRYIGLCTYDTNAMPTGKFVTVPIKNVRGSELPFWWYRKYHSESGYVMLDEVGMDISFRKHYNHGVEIRFLDWVPASKLQIILEFYVYLADLSLDSTINLPDEAIMSESFNNLLVNMLKHGSSYIVPISTVVLYQNLLGISLVGDYTIEGLYNKISEELREKYRNGLCARSMI